MFEKKTHFKVRENTNGLKQGNILYDGIFKAILRFDGVDCTWWQKCRVEHRGDGCGARSALALVGTQGTHPLDTILYLTSSQSIKEMGLEGQCHKIFTPHLFTKLTISDTFLIHF